MLGIDEIMAVLPHRYPFLMVDSVSEVSEERILAHKQVSVNEPFFPGHFPGYPVMPGVLVVEALAQAGVLLAHHCGNFDPVTQRVFFASVDRAKFRKPVRPGHQLDLDVVPLRKGAKVWKLKGEARVAGEVVAEAELMATIAAATPQRNGDGGA